VKLIGGAQLRVDVFWGSMGAWVPQMGGGEVPGHLCPWEKGGRGCWVPWESTLVELVELSSLVELIGGAQLRVDVFWGSMGAWVSLETWAPQMGVGEVPRPLGPWEKGGRGCWVPWESTLVELVGGAHWWSSAPCRCFLGFNGCFGLPGDLGPPDGGLGGPQTPGSMGEGWSWVLGSMGVNVGGAR